MHARSFGAAAVAACALLGAAAPALASGGNDTSAKLRRVVTVEGIRVHQGALNLIGLAAGGDFGSMVNSASTDTTAPVWAADLVLPSPLANTSTSGCEAADFAGMPAGAIVLIQRGTCAFLQKWQNAQAAGAGGIVQINEGDSPARTDPLWFDLAGSGITVPMGAAQIATVEQLAGSVRQGLVGKIAFAQELRNTKTKNKIRFIWFSAEESGLLGSEAYVASLPDSERAKIAAMLNFDMIGSPNYVNFVYDGDLSDSDPLDDDVFAPSARPFSATIEKLFLDYYSSQHIPNLPTAFDGRSDYGPFIANGIPAGGLFTGAEGIKTPEQAAIWGGTAGEQYDQCYHLGCDDFFNNSNRALDQNADAAAHVLITLAQSKIPDRAAAAPTLQRRAATGTRGPRIPSPQHADAASS